MRRRWANCSLLYLLVAAAFANDPDGRGASGPPAGEPMPARAFAMATHASHHALVPWFYVLVTFNSCMADSVAPNTVFWLRFDQLTACAGCVLISAHHYTSTYRFVPQLVAELAFGISWIMYARLAVTPRDYVIRQSLWHVFSVAAALVDISTPLWRPQLLAVLV